MKSKESPEIPGLSAGEVHLWSTSLLGSSKEIQDFREVLDEKECDRAGRFRFEKHRRRFLVSHGQLRIILGGYLKRPPGDLVFKEGKFGKPFIEPSQIHIHFNLSHSADRALMAFSLLGPVGVDTEQIRHDPSLLEISRTVFTERELAHMDRTPEKEKPLVLLRYWTAKEAVMKATGKGLQLPPKEIEAYIEGPEPPRFTCVNESRASENLALHPLPECEKAGFTGALVVPSGISRNRISWFYWPGSDAARASSP